MSDNSSLQCIGGSVQHEKTKSDSTRLICQTCSRHSTSCTDPFQPQRATGWPAVRISHGGRKSSTVRDYSISHSSPPLIASGDSRPELIYYQMMIGAVGWGTVSDLLGRALPFNSTLFLTAVFGIGASFSPTFPVLLFWMFLLGSAVG